MTDPTTPAAVDPQLVRELAQQAIAEMAFRYDAVGSVLAARGLDHDQYAPTVIAHIDAATVQVSWPDERPQQERGGDAAAARIQAFTDAWTDVPGMEGFVAGLGIPTRLDLTIDDLRAVVAELKRLRAAPVALPVLRQAWRNGWSDRAIAMKQTITNANRERDDYERAFARYMSDDPTEADKDPFRPVDGPDDPAAEQQAEPRPGHGPGVPGAMHLDAFGRAISDAFGHAPYHVGSSATSKTWRDVDVRLILPDDEFDALFPAWGVAHHIDAWWSLLCAALSELGRVRTGLPIDFQIQRQTEANEKYPTGIRNPLMLIYSDDEHRPAKKPVQVAPTPHCTRCGRWDYDGHWTEGPDTAWLCGNCHVELAAGAR